MLDIHLMGQSLLFVLSATLLVKHAQIMEIRAILINVKYVLINSHLSTMLNKNASKNAVLVFGKCHLLPKSLMVKPLLMDHSLRVVTFVVCLVKTAKVINLTAPSVIIKVIVLHYLPKY